MPETPGTLPYSAGDKSIENMPYTELTTHLREYIHTLPRVRTTKYGPEYRCSYITPGSKTPCSKVYTTARLAEHICTAHLSHPPKCPACGVELSRSCALARHRHGDAGCRTCFACGRADFKTGLDRFNHEAGDSDKEEVCPKLSRKTRERLREVESLRLEKAESRKRRKRTF